MTLQTIVINYQVVIEDANECNIDLGRNQGVTPR